MKKIVSCTAVYAAVLVSGLAMVSPAQAALPFLNNDEVPTLAPMLEKTTPAIVSISVEGKHKIRQQIPDLFRYFYGPNAPKEQVQEQPFKGLGSGVIIDAKEGYIVTNAHVVDNADEIIVSLGDGREVEAKKIGEDKDSDIALLKVEPNNLKEVPLADSDKLRVGDFVVAIGNPFGIGKTVTSGIVSALGRSTAGGINLYEDYIQTDAAINRGNSGGALVNLKGELVGINTAIIGPNGGNVGIGFAIPANMMKSLVDQIIKYGEVRRGLLGITGQNVDAGLAEAMGLDVNQGAFVREVAEDSAAAKGGIEPGDIIIELNGKNIESFNELRAKIGTLGAGTEVKLKVLREGKRKDISVTLDDFTARNISAEEIHPALDGATLADGETENNEQGVAITELTRRSNADRLGLQEGDVIIGVNRKRVTNVAELRRALDDNERGVIALNVKRGRSSLYLVIR
ncbi:DegQ family serine endoprotease [Paraneptunicella aestuarii]|uniref:DegQ family serine endoprotease n=1 Tax=Paraneptunicella aestuarii TaxID=2831148 RepID=UPI001E47E443|nr:DegQ family serine endoprotease [Paraneptunicella aestuarii]UAA38437.1 DegQ family serine endoprotease [Paraneptunicella aestuarii]